MCKKTIPLRPTSSLQYKLKNKKKKSVYSEKHCAIRKTKSRHIIYWSNLPFCSASVHWMHILFTFLHFPSVGLHEMWHTVQCIYVVWSKTFFFFVEFGISWSLWRSFWKRPESSLTTASTRSSSSSCGLAAPPWWPFRILPSRHP